jgi:hypothetical protein
VVEAASGDEAGCSGVTASKPPVVLRSAPLLR